MSPLPDNVSRRGFLTGSYDGAPHGFHADYRPSYRAEAAQDGWQRLQAWFRQHGVA